MLRLVLHLHVIHTNHLPLRSRLLLDRLTVTQIFNKFPKFLQLTGSLLCSQQCTTCPCPRQTNPVNDLPQYFFKIHFSILPPTPRSLKTPFSFRSTYKKLTCLSTLPLCVIYPTHLPSSIWSPKKHLVGTQIMKLLIVKSSPVSNYSFHLRTKYLAQHPIFTHPQILFCH